MSLHTPDMESNAVRFNHITKGSVPVVALCFIYLTSVHALEHIRACPTTLTCCMCLSVCATHVVSFCTPLEKGALLKDS